VEFNENVFNLTQLKGKYIVNYEATKYYIYISDNEGVEVIMEFYGKTYVS